MPRGRIPATGDIVSRRSPLRTHKSLITKVDPCADKKVEMPMSPLWDMGMARFGAQIGFLTGIPASVRPAVTLGSFYKLVFAIRYLTCKAKAKCAFDEDEKEFMKELFEGFWWGGEILGSPEAAQLSDHYVNGDGARLSISAECYNTSVIVKDVMSAMRLFMAGLVTQTKQPVTMSSDTSAFKNSCGLNTNRDAKTQGQFKDGLLVAEQNNQRLHKANNRFYLRASTVASTNNTTFTTKWFVDDVYNFESFEKHDYVTKIPLGDHTLELPDGLSYYLTQIGVAKEFPYHAEWFDTWTIKDGQPLVVAGG